MEQTTFNEKNVRDAGPSLREVVANRVKEAIEKYGPHAADAWQRIKEQGKLMQDYIVPVGTGGKVSFHHSERPGGGSGPLKLIASASNGEDIVRGSMHNNALVQLGEKLGIPGTWLRDMATGEHWQRDRAQHLLNGYGMHHQKVDGKGRKCGPENMLIRLVSDQVRGVLSDRYKRLDTTPIFSGFITQGYAMGAKLYDGELTDLRAYMELLLPEIHETVLPGVKDPVYTVFGARISSSDFGHGSLDVRGFYMQGACLNGMVRINIMKEIHLGKRMELGDIMSDETVKKDAEVTKLAVGDAVRHVLSKKYIDQTLTIMQRAADVEVDVQEEVRALNKGGILTKEECAEVDALIANGRPEDGLDCGPSAWKVLQGVTAMIRDKDKDRACEIQVSMSTWLDKQVGGLEAKFAKEKAEVEAK